MKAIRIQLCQRSFGLHYGVHSGLSPQAFYLENKLYFGSPWNLAPYVQIHRCLVIIMDIWTIELLYRKKKLPD